MFRGCFCDCFGPFKWPTRQDELDKDLDPEDVAHALAKVRAYEERRAASAHAYNEVRHPLVLPSVETHGGAPYDQVIPPPASMTPHHVPIHQGAYSHCPSAPPLPSVSQSILPPRPRPSSPPPAYSSVDNIHQSTAI